MRYQAVQDLQRQMKAKRALPLSPENLYPCPKCGRMVNTYRPYKSTVLVGCDYDCGPYYMMLMDWFDYYDEWEPAE